MQRLSVWVFVWFGLPVLSLVLGLARVRHGWVLPAPGLNAALGLYSWLNQPPNYDMPGFGLMFYCALAVLCCALFGVGRGLRWCIRRFASRFAKPSY